jgi:hypothetical protein
LVVQKEEVIEDISSVLDFFATKSLFGQGAVLSKKGNLKHIKG